MKRGKISIHPVCKPSKKILTPLFSEIVMPTFVMLSLGISMNTLETLQGWLSLL